ncbi:TPR-like protein [Gymnopus androsaceus JB14]|uniref:TPR-like protein n=1 Tax=Gymnopus androsaceus JB14 TaxID=1447944 RepID=A0A6A4HMJ4_9AGAR|nr:TPR-like protein [Gymnopus androsaceus JB14]
MFHQASDFSINGGQFIYNNYSSGQPLNQNPTITYEKIKLATPAAPTVFTAAQQLCQNQQAHLAILGAGGMGKTALALHIMKDEGVKDKFKDKSYFVPCEMFPDASSLVQGLFHALKLSVPKGYNAFETFERYLESAQDPMLLVLDNFETPWNAASDQYTVKNLIEGIRDQELVSIVLTMRAADGPGDIIWYKLGGYSGLPPLDLDAAKHAFMLISNSKSEDIRKLHWLLTEIDCMPLAILLIAQLRKQLSLDTLIKKWKKQKTKMLKNGAQPSRLSSVTISIDLSMQMLLGSANKECIHILPNQILTLKLAVSKCYPPFREDLQSKYPTKAEHLTQMGKYYLKLLKNNSPGKNQDVIEAHSANVVKVFQIQLRNSPQQEYLEGLYNFTEYTKFYPSSVELIDIALSQTCYNSYDEELKLRFEKENSLCWMGYYDKAKSEIETIQQRLNDVSIHSNAESKANHIGRCLQSLGNICRMQAEYVEATTLLINAKIQFEKVGNQLGVAQCLQSLGDICSLQNEYSEAKVLFTDAKTQFKKIRNQLGTAQCLQSLGHIYYLQDEYTEAKVLLTDAKGQFEKVGSQVGAAQCLHSLGAICSSQGEYAEAKVLLTDAKNQHAKVGDQLGAAQCLQNLGNNHRMQGEYSEARIHLTDSKAQFEKLGAQLGAAQCLLSLGNICSMEGKWAEAKGLLTDAKTQFGKIQSQVGVAQCLQCLGMISSRPDEATVFLTEAKTQFQQLGDQLGTAQCLAGLGNICRMQDEYSDARLLFMDAKAQFEKCLQNLGDICRMQAEYMEATTLLINATTQFEKLGHQFEAAQCLQSLGNICVKQVPLKEAKTKFEKCLKMLGNLCSIQDAKGQFEKCLQDLANACKLQHEYAEAEVLLMDALTQFENLGDQLGAAQCLQLAGEYSEAKVLLTDAKFGVAQCLESHYDEAKKVGGHLDAAQFLENLHDTRPGSLQKILVGAITIIRSWIVHLIFLIFLISIYPYLPALVSCWNIKGVFTLNYLWNTFL